MEAAMRAGRVWMPARMEAPAPMRGRGLSCGMGGSYGIPSDGAHIPPPPPLPRLAVAAAQGAVQLRRQHCGGAGSPAL